jgi:hypothetical protein
VITLVDPVSLLERKLFNDIIMILSPHVSEQVHNRIRSLYVVLEKLSYVTSDVFLKVFVMWLHSQGPFILS